MQLMFDVEIRIRPGEPIAVIVDGENIADRITGFTLDAPPGRRPTMRVEFPCFHGSAHCVFKEVDNGRA